MEFKIKGITCDSCVKIIKKRIGKIDGVAQVKIDKDSGNAEILSFKPVAIEEIKQALKDTDYKII